MQPLPNIYLCCVFYDSMLVVHNNLPDLLWKQSGLGSRDLGSPARLCGLCAWVVWPMLHRCDSFMAAVHIGWQVLKRSAVPWQCYSWGWIEYDILSVRGRSKWKLLFVICDRIGNVCEWRWRPFEPPGHIRRRLIEFVTARWATWHQLEHSQCCEWQRDAPNSEGFRTIWFITNKVCQYYRGEMWALARFRGFMIWLFHW